MTIETAIKIEEKYNVYVDSNSNSFNHSGYTAVYGWTPIPANWISEFETCSK